MAIAQNVRMILLGPVGGLLFNAVCGLVLWWWRPGLSAALAGVVAADQASPWLAAMLLGVQVIEVAGWWWMRRPLGRAIGRTGGAGFGLVFGFWVLHPAVNLILTMYALRAWGVVLAEEPDGGQWPAMLVLGLVVVKELLLLALLAMIGRPISDEAASAPLQGPDEGAGWRELAGRLCHLGYAAVAMTACWDVIAARTPVHLGNPLLAVLELVASSLFFLMIFVPVRGLTLWADWTRHAGRVEKAVFLLSQAVVVAVALAVLPAA